jgi:two-component system phosphate regulon sensor histidine kinase PhoR
MPYSSGIKALVALGIVAAGALAGLLLNGDVQTSLVMLVCGVAAVLVATAGGEPVGRGSTPPPPWPRARASPKCSRRSPNRCC